MHRHHHIIPTMLTGLFLRFNARCFGAPPFISLSLMDRIPILKQALYSWIKRQCGNQASVSFSRLTSARHVQTGWTSMLKLTVRSITRVAEPCYIPLSNINPSPISCLSLPCVIVRSVTQGPIGYVNPWKGNPSSHSFLLSCLSVCNLE